MIFVGIDWAEAHHDVCVLDGEGTVLAGARIPDGFEGVGRLHALLGEHAVGPGEVIVGIETGRGLLAEALTAAGYVVHAINPFSASRYRERHTTSRAKSDPGDARMLADIVRTDRQHHRIVAADSELLGAIRVLARAHQDLIWSRQRQHNAMRSALREYYPGALLAFPALGHPDALAVLAIAPDPERGRRLGEARIISLLRRAGRQRNLERRAKQIRTALRAPQLVALPLVVEAQAARIVALVAVITTMNEQIDRLEADLEADFDRHPDAEILRSLPGLGPILGARVLAGFGDAPGRYVDAKARRNYAGTSPITRASGTSHVVAARFVRNKRLFDPLYAAAFSALRASPGARAYYDAHDPGPRTSKVARRKLANKLVGILHGCLAHRTPYDEAIAWGQPAEGPSEELAA